MNSLLELIQTTPEYRGWGWNVMSGSFLATAGFTFGLQLPGLVNQARKIWKNRSAEGVEMLTFISFFSYFVVFLVYAFATRSGAGMVNTVVLLPPQLFILVGVFRFKQRRTIDTVAALAGTTLFVLTIVLPQKEVFFSIASVAVFIGLLLQSHAMIKARTSSNVALSFPLSFATVSLVWMVYAFVTRNWFLSAAAGLFAFAYFLIVALWFKFRVRAGS